MEKPTFKWKVEEMCNNCPFMEEGDGRTLRDSLARGRWDSIITGLLRGDRFECHKTTRETGNGTNLYCAGALAFQHARGIVTSYMKVCERLEGTRESKEEMFRRLRGITKRKGSPCSRSKSK